MYVIKQSNVNGSGCFSTTFIDKGKDIMEVKGERIPYKEFHSKYNDTKNSIKVLNWYYISFKEEPYFSSNDIRYINESKDPNVYYKQGKVKALRDIEIGEELFLRYPKNYTRDYLL